jgi:S-adenosyl methyltransferase
MPDREGHSPGVPDDGQQRHRSDPPCRSLDAPRPSAAGIHDVLLGGQGGLLADQQAAEELLIVVPDTVMAAYQGRSFRQRVVRYLARQAGIRQFVEITAGLSVASEIYEIAHQEAPDVRVARIDALAASHPDLGAVVSLAEPVAVLLFGVLHFVTDDEDPYGFVAAITRQVVPGSYLAISHATADDLPPQVTERVLDLYQNAAVPLVLRSRQEIACFLDGLELVRPGVVNGSSWRPGYAAFEPRRTLFYAALGRKR